MTVKLVLLITTVASLLILENKFPFFRFQNSLGSRVAANFGLGAINSILASIWTIGITQFVVLPQLEFRLVAMIPNPVIAGILSCLIIDLYMYFWHRSMHRLPLAWKFHRLHHTDRSMNVSTAYRFHPIEIISSSIPKLLLIWLLGISSDYVLIYELMFIVVVALHHSNLAIPKSIDQLLGLVIITPNLHRIHHSQIVTETNSNYGSILNWWDRIFRTNNDRPDVINIQLGLTDNIIV
ncbi:MAG: sterol desaturase family protein [Chamaesiphon sp.]|nr:sterol desaturase family protein [Chamaesiphon sp.]